MAATKGHGNPRWNREETILALDLYHRLDGQLRKANAEVDKLSDFLRALPYHGQSRRNDTFRNTDGVYFKLQNIRNVLTGEGLSNTSKMDKAVAEKLGGNPAETARLAKIIRESVANLTEDDFDLPDALEEEFYEGRSAFVSHRKIERDARLRKKILQKR